MRDLIAKVYRPNSEEHSGTAWLASERHALTAFHCIDDMTGAPFPGDTQFRLKFESGLEIKAVMKEHDPNVDVALLEILDRSFPAARKVVFGKLPLGEEWLRYRSFQTPVWESYGYPSGYDLGLAVNGVINQTNAIVNGRLRGQETALQLTCEHGGQGNLDGLSGSAVVHNGSVVGIVRSGPTDFNGKIIHAISIERIAQVLEPVQEIIRQSFVNAVSIVAPNILAGRTKAEAHSLDEERRSSKTRTNVPRKKARVHGRDGDTLKIASDVVYEKKKFISLTGPDGTGRKALALSVANEFLGIVEGVFLVDLYPVQQERALLEIANAIGVKEAHSNMLEVNLAVEIGSKSTIVIVFAAEQLKPHEQTIRRLIEACDNLHFIAVTSVPFGWAMEHVYPVQPLDLASVPAQASTNEIAGTPAIEFFAECAKLIDPEFEISDANSRIILDLCTRAGCSRLALRLLAALSGRFLMSEVERFKELGSLYASLEKIQGQTFAEKHRALIVMVLDRIDPDVRTLLFRLSIFSGSCSSEGAFEMDRTAFPSGLATRKKLEILLKHGMIYAYTTHTQHQRYAMPVEVRSYCHARMCHSGEMFIGQRDHANYYWRLVNQIERRITIIGGSDIPKALETLEAEYNNIIAAIQWFRDSDDSAQAKRELGLDMVGNLFWFWNLRGSLHEGRTLAEDMLKLQWEETEAFGTTLYCAGGLSFLQGDFASARPLLTRSIAVLERTGNERRLAYALVVLGMVALHHNEIDAALWHEQRAVQLFGQIDNSVGIALANNDLANVLLEKQKLDEAERLYLVSYKLWKDLNNLWGLGLTCCNLGHLASRKGNYDAAERWLMEAMSLQQGGRYQWGFAESVKGMGYVALAKGQLHTAASLFYDSLILHQRIGRLQLVADCIDGLAGVAVALEQVGDAGVLLGASEAIRDKIGAKLTSVIQKKREDMLRDASQICERQNKNPAVFDIYLSEGRNLDVGQAAKRAAEFARDVKSNV